MAYKAFDVVMKPQRYAAVGSKTKKTWGGGEGEMKIVLTQTTRKTRESGKKAEMKCSCHGAT